MPDQPVVVAGNRSLTSNLGTTTNFDFSRDLVLDHESEVPLLTLVSKIKEEKTNTNKFKFAVGRMAPRESTATVAVVAGAVGAEKTLTVANGEFFTEHDVIEVSDAYNDATHDNQLYVVSVSNDDLTVRSYDPATYGVPTIDLGSVVAIIGSAVHEASEGRNPSQTVPTVYEQFCQTFEDYFRISNIEDANEQYVLAERARLREEKRKKHAVDQDNAYWFSKRVEDLTTATNPRHQMGGIIDQITSNVLNYGAELAQSELNLIMTKVHNPMYSAGMKRLVFASGDLLARVNDLASNALRITTKDKTWGPNITIVQYAGRTWEFVEAPALSSRRPGWGVITHPRFLKKRPLIKTRYEMNVQIPKAKYIEDGFYSVNAVEIKLEEVFGIIRP